MNGYIKLIGKTGLMPAITINHAENAIDTAKAFLKGGQPIAEVTMRTPDAEESIKIISGETDFIVGAGTVLTISQAEKAIKAGAKFLVSPGLNPDVVKYAQDMNCEIIPGVATPSEIETALSLGVDILKLFPADVLGGSKMLKALAGPYSMVKFIPMGGLKADNMEEYLLCPNVFALGGTWMAKKDLIDRKEFDQITALTKEALSVINSLRGDKRQ